jgi:hypothetical protein
MGLILIRTLIYMAMWIADSTHLERVVETHLFVKSDPWSGTPARPPYLMLRGALIWSFARDVPRYP